MSAPVPGVTYTRQYPSREWVAPGRPTLNPTVVSPSDPTPTTYPVITLRVTKPDASNTGAGLIRPLKGVLNPGDPVPGGSWSGDVLTMTQNLVDYDVKGRYKRAADGLLVENCRFTANPAFQVTGGSAVMDMGGTFTPATVRYCTIQNGYQSRFMNGFNGRNYVAEFNNVSRVTDMFSPGISGTTMNVQVTIRGNYCHDHQLYYPDSGHTATPTTTSGGQVLQSGTPFYNVGWNHCDGLQLQTDGITGIESYGNNWAGGWANDPAVSTLPLPYDTSGNLAIKEIAVFMLNAGTNFHSEDDWFGASEYAVNNADSTVSGWIKRGKFSRLMAHTGTADSTYFALMVAAPNLLTFDGTVDQNVWEDTGKLVPRRAN